MHQSTDSDSEYYSSSDYAGWPYSDSEEEEVKPKKKSVSEVKPGISSEERKRIVELCERARRAQEEDIKFQRRLRTLGVVVDVVAFVGCVSLGVFAVRKFVKYVYAVDKNSE